MSRYLDGYSYGGERPSLAVQAASGRWRGDEKCPCCGGKTWSAVVVCGTCKRDATYDPKYALVVKAVEEKLKLANG
jgi:hypothetical protein